MPAALTITRRVEWEALLKRFAVLEPPDRRRKAARHALEGALVEMAYAKEGCPRTRTGRVMNASVTGLMVRWPERIAEGEVVLARVSVGGAQAVLSGRVAHATETVGAFKIGIELAFGP